MNTMTTFTYLLNLEKSLDPGMEKKIKKYETIDEQAFSKVVSKIKEEYL